MRLDAASANAIPADAQTLREVAAALLAAGRIALLDEREFPAYMDKLRRSLPYWIHAVNDADTRQRLERQMFWDNYKGSTDLLNALRVSAAGLAAGAPVRSTGSAPQHRDDPVDRADDCGGAAVRARRLSAGFHLRLRHEACSTASTASWHA